MTATSAGWRCAFLSLGMEIGMYGSVRGQARGALPVAPVLVAASWRENKRLQSLSNGLRSDSLVIARRRHQPLIRESRMRRTPLRLILTVLLGLAATGAAWPADDLAAFTRTSDVIY